MEEVVIMDMVETGQDLEKNAFDAAAVQAFVLTSFHKLVQISIHVLHTDMQLLGRWIQEDLESRNEMRVDG